uniref:A-kinase anchoring protein 13 n=1 Tax=Pseudonaja textilis TaxID=8673 RepID=A0A670YD06_PSETE
SKTNPTPMPSLNGDCIITILLTEDDHVESDDVIFYLVFTGSALQHCTSTRKLDSGRLETIAPGHDCCETVKVSLCATKQGHPLLVVAEESLQFVQDEVYDAAQFLASCAGNQQALNFTRFLDRSRPPAGDLDFLDEKVTLAFCHLKLPTEWNVLGTDHSLNENVPRETLLHFAARLGLLRLTWFLLKQPGGRSAVTIPNSEGATPVSLALERGYQKLHHILTKEEVNEPDSWSTLSHIVHSGDSCIKYHQGLNLYTLTTEMKEGDKLNMEKDIAQLQLHIQNLQRMVRERACIIITTSTTAILTINLALLQLLKQPEEEQSAGRSSTSSADDTISLERNSSISVPRTSDLLGSKERCSPDGSCFNMGTNGEGQDGMAVISGELDELLDSVMEVSPPSSGLPNNLRPSSPFRRHSWGPGKNSNNVHHRSCSLCDMFYVLAFSISDHPSCALCDMFYLLAFSISEESGSFPPSSPSRKDLEGKSGTKVSRTFSYLRNKMSSSKKSKEKEKEKLKERDKDSKEKDKDNKILNGHLFSVISTVGPVSCYHCLKPFNKDSFVCANCSAIVHKSCKENVASCAKVKMKVSILLDFFPVNIFTCSQPKERPRSAILAPDENITTAVFNSRRSQQNLSLSKSVSIQNIAGVGNDESILHTRKFLSQSTDSLNKICRVNESMESLTDEGADMNEGQLMGDFETDLKHLEAQSWSQVVDSKFLKQQKKDIVKRQDVIYELMQTEMHHVRTLKIMSDVYSRGMVQELQFEQQMVEKIFPCLDNLLNIHSQFFQRILERKKESLADRSEKNFVIKRIGDLLVNQFSGENAERMKKTYGKFCGHHNEAVNYFKDLHSKDKRFQAFIKKKMSSSVVRRLGIPECILLVTQRITKYPVLLQRILQYTKENDTEHQDLVLSLNLVKEVLTAVDSKVSNYEKKMRLSEIYTRTDSKSIMRMKSGQMFAREDLRRRKFVRDGPVSLKNVAGRLKEVLAVLLSDVLIFLQEKDQKYVFASLDQKSTVISLKKLIVREVAHEEKGLFLISMGGKDPEMVEVHAGSKEERNSWIQIIQDTINTMDKEEDEGIPSESEEEKRVLDTKARELKEQLQQKDQQIITLLEEKEKIFRDMTDCSGHEEGLGARMLFRANTEEAPKGESIMKNLISEVEQLQGLVSRSLGSAFGQQVTNLASDQESVGPISLPRRAETFGGFDSHQMNVYKGGEKDEGEEVQDLRRTESDSVLKKVWNEPLKKITQPSRKPHLSLFFKQAVVVQQDTYIEDQKLLLTERTLSRISFRPNSLIEQEKQRSLEKQRQELANLQKQQTLHQEERRKKEKEWEAREKELTERESQLGQKEEQIQKEQHSLEKEREELQQKKAAYQLDLEHLRTAQKQLEKEKEQLKREMEQISQPQMEPNVKPVINPNQHAKMSRTSSSLLPTEDLSSRQLCSSLPKGHLDTELSVSSKRNSLSRTNKEKSSFHLIGTTTSGQTNKPTEGPGQIPNRLFGLAKPKEKKEKKKKSKRDRSQTSGKHRVGLMFLKVAL